MASVLHLLFVITAISTYHVSAQVPKSKVVKCAVCKSLVNELHSAIDQVDPRKKVDVGSYRLDKDGKQKLASVKYAGSEMHMLDVLETVCESFKDYAQARHKETGKLEAIKLIENGAMNPRFNEYEMVQDPDLNKGLNFHCDSIVEEYEDDIVSHFRKDSELERESSQFKFCNKVTSICKGIKEEL